MPKLKFLRAFMRWRRRKKKRKKGREDEAVGTDEIVTAKNGRSRDKRRVRERESERKAVL